MNIPASIYESAKDAFRNSDTADSTWAPLRAAVDAAIAEHSKGDLRRIETLESCATNEMARANRAEEALTRAGWMRCDNGEWRAPIGRKPLSLSVPRYDPGGLAMTTQPWGEWVMYSDIVEWEHQPPVSREAAAKCLQSTRFAEYEKSAILDAIAAMMGERP